MYLPEIQFRIMRNCIYWPKYNSAKRDIVSIPKMRYRILRNAFLHSKCAFSLNATKRPAQKRPYIDRFFKLGALFRLGICIFIRDGNTYTNKIQYSTKCDIVFTNPNTISHNVRLYLVTLKCIFAYCENAFIHAKCSFSINVKMRSTQERSYIDRPFKLDALFRLGICIFIRDENAYTDKIQYFTKCEIVFTNPNTISHNV